jgi:hypothetical protein
MKISNNVLQFASGNMKLFEQFQDYWNHYCNREGKKTEYDTTISFDEKEQKLNAALRKEIIRRSGVVYAQEGNISEWFYHPLVQHEMFAVIGAMIDMVLPVSVVESIGIFTDVRQGGFGDSFSFDVEPRDLFVVSKSGKSVRGGEVHKQFKGQVTIIPEFHQITVGVSLYGVLSGKESLANLVAKAVRSMEVQMSLDAYNAFATAFANLSSTATTGLQVSGYSQASLIRIAEQVSAWNGGAKAIVLGTSLALLNVLPDDANYRYTLDDKFVTLGYIPTMAGYDIMRLPQVADLSTPFGRALSDSYLWILSPGAQKILKLCLEGQTIAFTDEPLANKNFQQNSSLIKSWNVGVVTNSVGGVIEKKYVLSIFPSTLYKNA